MKINVRPTRTDSAGNGYYTGSDGNIYYGNTQNGYLVETEETKRLKAEKAAQSASHSQTNRSYSSKSSSSSDSILDMLAIKAGAKFGEVLAKVLFAVVPVLVKVVFVVMLPSFMYSYADEFIAYNTHFGMKLLSILGLLAVVALVGYGLYRKIKGQTSITKQVFWGEMVALTGIYYLNTRSDEFAIISSLFMAFFFAFSLKVFSTWLEAIVYKIYVTVRKK